MSFWTYMLHCNAGRLYVGHTDNLEARLAQHERGTIRGFTRSFLPVKLVWSQEFSTRYEALASERQIKGWSRAKKLALVREDWDAISYLAKSKTGLRQAQPERNAGGIPRGGAQPERNAGGIPRGGAQPERDLL